MENQSQESHTTSGGRNLELEVSPTFDRNREAFLDARYRNIVNEGGSGSGKTYSLLQLLVFEIGLKETGKIISIVRETFAELRTTAMRDFYKILENAGLYKPDKHNKSESTYTLNGNVFEFIGMDKAHKKRGARRDYLYCNEATGLKKEDWIQLAMRTRKKVFIDYNPSFTEHDWIDEVISRPDTKFIHSTYIDNKAFLSQQEIEEIEHLTKVSYFHEQVYKYGKRAVVQGQIFRYQMIDEMPADVRYVWYGMDFGFTQDPTTLIKIGRIGDDLYLQELIYKRGLTNPDILQEVKSVGVKPDAEIIADSAEPKSIAELNRMGMNVIGVTKSPDSVRFSINTLQKFNIYIVRPSINMKKEADNYIWKQNRDGVFQNEPIDGYDHAWDAVRYVALMKLMNNPSRPRMTF